MKKLNKLITIIFLAVLCACSSDDDNKPTPNAHPHWEFLKVGNSWTYEFTDYDDGSKDTITEQIISITGNTVGVKWRDGSNIQNFKWYANKEYFSNSEDFSSISLYKVSYVGQKWNDSNWTNEVISISETVEVPAGTFYNCVKIKIIYQNIQNFPQYYYYCYKHGHIMTEYHDLLSFPDRIIFTAKLISKNF